MPEAHNSIPPDMQALAKALRKTDGQWVEVSGSTLDISGNLARAENDRAKKLGEDAAAMVAADIERHVAMWQRFCNRLARRPLLAMRNPKIATMSTDIRLWEAAKAGVNLEDERKVLGTDLTLRQWFMGTSAAGRVELVKQERARRAEERRFRLAIDKKRIAA